MNKFNSKEEIVAAVQRMEYIGDFIQIKNVVYELVYYSLERAMKIAPTGKYGSKEVIYYNTATDKEVTLNYDEGTVCVCEAMINWQNAHGRCEENPFGEVIIELKSLREV